MSLAFLTAKLTVKDGERALLTRNGRIERVLGPGRHRLFDPLRPADGRKSSTWFGPNFRPIATRC